MTKIAVDVMGGDYSPKAGVEGANLVVSQNDDIEIVLFGDQTQIEKYLTPHPRVSIIHCDQEITNSDNPTKIIRKKTNSSLVKAVNYVKDGLADAFISSGSTGAILTACTLTFGRLKNIKRPSCLAVLPTLGGVNPYFTIIDAGTNVDCSSEFLHQFAHFSKLYNQFVLGIKNPKIGLLSNGTEEGKGNELAKETFKLLKSDPQLNFIGNVEGNSMLTGQADALVSDGFSMNIALKSLEGTSDMIRKILNDVLTKGSLKTRLGGKLVKDELDKALEPYTGDFFTGAVLMGVGAPVVITHGAADAKQFSAGINQVAKVAQSNLVAAVEDYFSKESGLGMSKKVKI